jgi:hypothetical protein
VKFKGGRRDVEREGGAEERGTRSRAVSIPKLPEDAPELCALKAYIMWEHAGKPDRDAAEEDREYRRGIDELNAELRAGLSLQVRSLRDGGVLGLVMPCPPHLLTLGLGDALTLSD